MYRFVHAADLHLDTPFQGLSRRSPDIAQQLRDASLQALDALADAAIERSCHFVLLSGDVYDGLERGARAQVRLRQFAERLDQAGIRLFLLHGNHDPVDEGYPAVEQWPAHTTILGAERPEVHAFDTDAGRVTITGQSYPSRSVPWSLADGYPAPAGEGLHVAMLHTELDAHGLEHPYSPCTLADLVGTSFHYWALGHVHDQRVLHERSPTVAFPGNLQGRHFAEPGPRGALYVSGAPHELTIRPLSLAPVTFHRVPVDVGAVGPLDEVVARLVESIPSEGGTLKLLRAELSGRTPHHAALATVSRDEWLRILQDRSPREVCWVDVRLDVASAVPLDTLAEAPSLAGALVRHARAGVDVRDILTTAPQLRRLAEALEPEALDHLLDRALARAIEAVGPEAP